MMNKLIKITLSVVLFILLGLFSYFGVKYLFQSRLGTKLEGLFLKDTEVVLTGVLIKGDAIDDVQIPHCAPQYYLLVSEKRAVWLIPKRERKVDWPEMFERYNEMQVRVSGNRYRDNGPCDSGQLGCGCDDYLIVDEITSQQ